jgi:hypothetical protein
MTRPRAHIGALEDHMPALGYLCVFYAHLDSTIVEFVGKILQLTGEDPACIGNPIDLSKKTQIVRALAFQHKPSEQWYNDVELVIWLIEDQLIPKRNRFVHDKWLAAPISGVMRKWYRTKIARPQSHKPLALTTYEYVSQTADDIWDVVDDIMVVSGSVQLLGRSLWKAEKKAREELLPQQLRDRWLARRKLRQQDAAAAQQRQQQSSPALAARKCKLSRKQRRVDAMQRRGK